MAVPVPWPGKLISVGAALAECATYTAPTIGTESAAMLTATHPEARGRRMHRSCAAEMKKRCEQEREFPGGDSGPFPAQPALRRFTCVDSCRS
jgi:hypothetical protein